MIVEYVLMIIVMLTVGIMLQKYLQQSKFVQNFTVEPWAKLNGMIQCGVWAPCGIEIAGPGLHPNSNERVLSLSPKDP